jgi:PTS system nitrogen regulatory IIA component
MPQSQLELDEVAATLHITQQEVARMAEQKILPAQRIKNRWVFRAGEIWNWMHANLRTLTERATKKTDDISDDLIVSNALNPVGVSLQSAAKTKASILRELAELAGAMDGTIDVKHLREALQDREGQGSTALEGGIAVPHPARVVYAQGPIIAAANTVQGVPFGGSRGGLTDMFFLVCCPTQKDHLLHLGRLCRLLRDEDLRKALRAAGDAGDFVDAVRHWEEILCRRGDA